MFEWAGTTRISWFCIFIFAVALIEAITLALVKAIAVALEKAMAVALA